MSMSERLECIKCDFSGVYFLFFSLPLFADDLSFSVVLRSNAIGNQDISMVHGPTLTFDAIRRVKRVEETFLVANAQIQ